MKKIIESGILEGYKTPYYAFDLKTLRQRALYLKEHLPKGVKLCYAMKANPFVAAAMREYIDKYEICSPGEISICMEQGLPANKFVISGVHKNYEDMLSLVSNASDVGLYTIESMSQYETLEMIAEKNKYRIPVLLRLTSGNQFGITADEIEQIVRAQAVKKLLDIKGIQFYSGTQKSNIDKIKNEIETLDNLIQNIKVKTGFEIEELEYGPGFPVEYFEPFKFDERIYLKELSDALDAMKSKVSLSLEIGRALTYSCGIYVTSVLDKKTNATGNYAIVDGGIHHIVYYGQIMAMKKPEFKIYPKREGAGTEKWNICGSLCTVNDILLKNIEAADLSLGDKIVFYNTGAYCVTEGISLFLSRALPSVLLIDENGNVNTAREHTDIYKLNY